MIPHSHATRSSQRGVVLVASLLLLIVVTIMALSMFRSFGIGEKIAGNMREKQRALQAAVTAQVNAEIWLVANATGPSVNCVGRLNGTLGLGQICANSLDFMNIDVSDPLAWKAISTWYQPNGMLISSTTSVALTNPTYYDIPAYYISDLGTSPDPTVPGELYLVDAYGYGGNSNTVAVVESTYAVYTSSRNAGSL
jgi:type IV pilus assembly protein PilX